MRSEELRDNLKWAAAVCFLLLAIAHENETQGIVYAIIFAGLVP